MRAGAAGVPPPADTTALRRPRSPWHLFLVFTRLALQGFGGVLPVAQHQLVERERWLSRAEFVELLSIGQVLPGPNVVNLTLMVGDRYFGLRGALAGLAGMLAAPLLLVLLAAALYARFVDVPVVAAALRGMGAVAAGLVIATSIKLARTLGGTRLGWRVGGVIAVATFVAVGLWRWPMVAVVFGLGSASVALAAGWQRRDRADAPAGKP